ncbi:MAG: hypothetical protein ABI818_14470 [Acidobacteriota bacterium]
MDGWRRRGALLLFAAGGALAPALQAQTTAPRPPDLLITRLEGAGAEVEAATAAQLSQRPTELAALPMTRLDDRAPLADLDGPRRITITMGGPLPVRDMLGLLVTGTPFSIVAAEAVEGTFAGTLKDLTMRETLEAVLFPRGMDYDLQGTVIRVFPRKLETRLFDVNYLSVRRSSRRGMRSAIAVSSGGIPAAEITAATQSDVLEELGRGVQSLLSESGRMHLDRTAGLVQVTDFDDRLEQVGLYVEAVQVRATRQVRIEARVLEVTLNSAAATSIDWNAVASRSGSKVRPGVARGAAGMRVDDFGAFARAIGEQGTVRMIAAPQVIAMNNEPAVMRVGTQGVYFTAASQTDRFGAVERTSTPVAVLEGLTMTVTAQIASDGIVQLDVAPTYAEKAGQSKSVRGEAFPVLRISEADTLMRVQEGDTVVISGFLQDRVKTKAGTGFTGFFGSQSRETVKAELVILLTPSVVSPNSASAVTDR